MKVLGLNTVLSIGTAKYLVTKITRNGVSLSCVKNQITVYDLKSIEENLSSGVMSVWKLS